MDEASVRITVKLSEIEHPGQGRIHICGGPEISLLQNGLNLLAVLLLLKHYNINKIHGQT